MNILCLCLSATIQRTLTFDSFSAGQVNRTQSWREDASGKAINTARVLNQLEPGCASALCPVGSANADTFMGLASRDNDLYIHPVFIEGKTRECWTVLDSKADSTTEIIADEALPENKIAGAEAELALIESVREYLENSDAFLFAGSRPKIWSANLCARICDVAKSEGKFIFTDFIGEDLNGTLNECIPDVIKMNEAEFAKTFGSFSSEDELLDKITKKSQELKNIVIVTRGEKDTLAAKNGKTYRCPSEKIKTVNTTACGDSFSAGFLHDYLINKDIEKALKEGSRCAALNAQTVVPGSIRLEQV